MQRDPKTWRRGLVFAIEPAQHSLGSTLGFEFVRRPDIHAWKRDHPRRRMYLQVDGEGDQKVVLADNALDEFTACTARRSDTDYRHAPTLSRLRNRGARRS
jgi:hypothetical protein